MKLELTKNDESFDEILFISRGLTTQKDEYRHHVTRVRKDKDTFISTNGARLHVYDHEGRFNGLDDGYYEVIKSTLNRVVLLFDKPLDEAHYPDCEDLISIRLDFPQDTFNVSTGHGVDVSKAYTDIVRNMQPENKTVKPESTNYLKYSYVQEALRSDRVFEVYNEHENKAVYLKSENLLAVIMQERG